MTDFYKDYKTKLAALVAKRDKVNAQVAPLQMRLNEANERAQEAARQADAIAAEIQKVRGGQAWLDLKKEIGLLAKLLSGMPKS